MNQISKYVLRNILPGFCKKKFAHLKPKEGQQNKVKKIISAVQEVGTGSFMFNLLLFDQYL